MLRRGIAFVLRMCKASVRYNITRAPGSWPGVSIQEFACLKMRTAAAGMGNQFGSGKIIPTSRGAAFSKEAAANSLFTVRRPPLTASPPLSLGVMCRRSLQGPAMNDRYIIVCRDGYASYPFPKLVADRLLASWLKTHHGKTRPAYRIRIREKAASPMDCAAP